MNQSDQRFWPFKPQASIVSAIAILVGLLLLVGAIYKVLELPGEIFNATVFLGIVAISLLPVVLAILDVVIERGGVIGFKDINIDFSQVTPLGMKKFDIPADLGVKGQAISDSDSDTTKILDALRGATMCDAAIIDLEDGKAWWETRLLVLLAGAERLKKPAKIVFVSTIAGQNKCFHGWAHSNDLLWRLVQANPQYLRSLLVSRAAARQWELVEPINPVDSANPGMKPVQPPWITGELAMQQSWMAFNDTNGLPNELLAEQYLATDLGQKIEMQGETKEISLVRLNELFSSLLVTEKLEMNSTHDEQISTIFDCEHTYIAITKKKRYSTLIAKVDIMNQMLRSMIEKKNV